MAPSLQQEVNLSRRACRVYDTFCHPVTASKTSPGAKLDLELNFNCNKCVNNHHLYLYNNNNRNSDSDAENNFSNSKIINKNNNDENNNLNSCSSDNNEKISSISFGDIQSCHKFKFYHFVVKIFSLIELIVMKLFGKSCGRSVKLSKMFLYLVIACVILANNASVLARPNLSSTATDGTTSSVKAERQLSSSELTDGTYPGLAFGPMGPISENQLKRSAEVPAIVSTTANSNEETMHAENIPQGHSGMEISQVDFKRVETPFVIGVWILFASIAKIGFHMTPNLNKIFPESCLLIVVGVIIGIVLQFGIDLHVSPLTPNTFFFYMLPPIILDAGYFMPNRLFFDNIGTILLMAVIGTIFNIATIGGSLYACSLTGMFGVNMPILDVFLFSSLVSAVDPVAVLAVFEEIHVNEVLYIVVFGESLLNDAVTVVLYHMFESYSEIGVQNIVVTDLLSGAAAFFVVALGGTIIGVIWGFLTGLVTRFTDHVRVIEPIFIFVMAYLAYLNAEIFHMSGILAITFCGITMKNYVEANISHKSHTTIKYALKMLSSSSETIIFMFLGVATVNNHHIWNTWFIILTILFCSFFRIIGVLILSAMANRFRIHKLTKVDQFVMSYGGLRGAVAFALVLLIDENHVPLKTMFVTTTIAVIYFTVFLQGITIKPLVKFLNVKRANKRKPTMNERIHERFIDHMMAGVEDIVGKTGNYNVRDKFKRFDNRFIRPYLIKNLQGPEPKILETYSKLTMRDAMDFMRRNPSTIGQMSGTESMSALFRNYTGYFGGSPSFSNLENSSRNLDMQELDYNPSKKDLTDARIHHLLSEELKPYRRHRRLSYSRHAVDDRDLSTQQVNYKMQMNIRRMIGEKRHHKRSKRVKEGKHQNHVSFPDFQQNGSAKQFANDYINEVLHEGNEEDHDKQSDDWDSGLTFTAKPTLDENGQEEFEDKRFSKDSESEVRVATPTAIETVLPWKRDDEDTENGGLKQHEFPSWASNKEYLAYNSPSATFLGGLTQPKAAKSVIGLFRRESSGSGGVVVGGVTDSETSTPITATTPVGRAQSDKRSASIAGFVAYDETNGDPLGVSRMVPHSNMFPVTASHRRNNRRGSMLEMSGLLVTGRRPSRRIVPDSDTNSLD